MGVLLVINTAQKIHQWEITLANHQVQMGHHALIIANANQTQPSVETESAPSTYVEQVQEVPLAVLQVNFGVLVLILALIKVMVLVLVKLPKSHLHLFLLRLPEGLQVDPHPLHPLHVNQMV